jgi:hypothetical protein
MTAVRAVRASILLALVLVLSGCGLTGQGFQPGVAVVVGDQTITQGHIGDLTGDYCRGVGDALKQQGQQVSLRYLSSQVVVPQLTIRLLVEQLAEELGVEPTKQYRTEVSTLRTRVADLDKDAADAVVEVESARSYYIDVLTSIGAKENGDSGDNGDESSAASDNLTSGREALTRWMLHGGAGTDQGAGDAPRLAINPRYGLRFAETDEEADKEGPLIRTGTDTSFAVSDVAKGGLAPETVEDPAYLASLPPRMICG